MRESLHLLPNPARDQVRILSDVQPGGALRMVDVYGRILRTESYLGHGHQMNLENLPTGRYVVQLFDLEGQVQVSPLQVIR